MAEYRNPWQWNDQAVEWDPNAPRQSPWGVTFEQVNPGYISGLLSLDARVRSGQATPEERQEYEAQAAAARAIPMRDPASLQFGWNNDEIGSWNEGGSAWWQMINGSSPDLGPVMLSIADRMDQGTASPQERALYQQMMRYDTDWDYRASVPQASDAFSIMGNDLLGPLSVLAMGATGGLAGGALAAGGAGLATTLGSLGTLAGVAGTGAGVIGQATDQDWLSQLGLGLGIAGGLAGGLGGLSNLWSSGVNSLSDAAKLASSAGKITGSLGRIPGAEPLKDVSRYLGYAGQAGNLGASLGADDWLGWSGSNSPLAANVAPGVSNLLSAADVATQRGGGGMSEWDYSWDYGGDTPYYEGIDTTGGWWDDAASGNWNVGADYSSGYSAPIGPGLGWDAGGYPTGGGEGSGSNWLGGVGSVLGSIGGFLGKNAGLIGPAASALGSLGGGAIGSNAANEAARLQAAAAQRGLDLQTAQWLQQQQNLAPYLQAGQGGLAQLQQLAGRQQPNLPGTQPFQYSGPEMPGTGFQYTGAGMPQTGFQYSGPGMPATGFQYTGPGMPTQDFKAPTWDELKARDPGIQARLAEAQKAIETSAAARGMTMSGSTLGALQRQSQTLAASEYAPAYGRALGEYQQEYGQDWQRQQEAYLRQRAENELLYGRGYQQQGDIYGRQLAENQLGYNRQWQQQMTDYERQLAQNQLGYGRGMEQYKLGYGAQAALNEQDYARQQALYKQQLAQFLLPYEQQSTLANLGGQAVGMYGNQGQSATNAMANLLGQVGTAQGAGSIGNALSWQKAIGGIGNQLPSILAGLNA